MSEPDAGSTGGDDRGGGRGPDSDDRAVTGRGQGREAAAAAAAEPPARRVRRAVLLLVAVLVVYYAAPVGDLPSGTGIVLSAVGLLAGVTVLAWAIVRQAQRLARSDPTDTSVRLDGLVFIVYVVVPMFALGYFALEKSDRGQFQGLDTKTDSLYYTISTLATVGFGDVNAAGQLARALVTVQIAFNLVFVATLASVLTSHIRERAASRRN